MERSGWVRVRGKCDSVWKELRDVFTRIVRVRFWNGVGIPDMEWIFKRDRVIRNKSFGGGGSL